MSVTVQRPYFITALLVLALVACRESRDSSKPKIETRVSATAVSSSKTDIRAATAGPANTAAAPSRITETDVRDFVAGWAAEQNDRNFSNYNELYAERFTGVKRVGQRAHHYDRASWMEDRQRMFASKSMRVEVGDLSVVVFGRSALARFEQRWSSGAFRDRGPKRLDIVREKGALRIVREEMLASNVE